MLFNSSMEIKGETVAAPNFGAFFEELSATENAEAAVWLSTIREDTAKEDWALFAGMPSSDVIYLLLVSIDSAAKEALYYSSSREFHDVIRATHTGLITTIKEKCQAYGIDSQSIETNRPLTPTDVMVAAGHVRVVEGMVEVIIVD